MPVLTGKCHNIQSIEAEDRARMHKKPKMLVRFCADFVMPAPRVKHQNETQVSVYTRKIKNSPYSEPCNLSVGRTRKRLSA
jgi:hypothetical protein